MKVVIPDLVSNSYFPAIAAVEMGFFKQEGIDAELELIYPVGKCYDALRDGKADFVGGSSHSAPTAFPEWQGVKFLGALAQHTYWFLIMRADLKVKRGDISAVKGKRIGAAPLIDIGLIELLKESGIDPKRDGVQIAPPPMPATPNVSFGVNAAQAMADGKIDGFWANGMGAEVAVQRGLGTLVLDARRGDGFRGEPDCEAGRARSAVLRPGDLPGRVRQHVQVCADRRPDQGCWQIRGRGGDAVRQFVEELTLFAPFIKVGELQWALKLSGSGGWHPLIQASTGCVAPGVGCLTTFSFAHGPSPF